MELKIIEVCEVQPGEDGITEGIREFCYSSKFDTFEKAVVDFINNFDGDNVYDSKDFFDGACSSSYVVSIMIYNDESCLIEYKARILEEDAYGDYPDICY